MGRIAGAHARIAEDMLRVQDADGRAHQALLSLYEAQQAAYERLPANRSALYRLLGVKEPGGTHQEAKRLRPPSCDPSNIPTPPSAVLYIGAGAMAGAALGAVFLFGAHAAKVALAPWLQDVVVLGSAVVLALACGAINGRKTMRCAAPGEVLAAAFNLQADAFFNDAARIVEAADAARRITVRLCNGMLEQQGQLEAIARDTTNAAILLRDVLNTPLVNEEGAFMQEVIDELHAQNKRIGKFASDLEAVAP